MAGLCYNYNVRSDMEDKNMTLTFKKWDNFAEELIINCYTYSAARDGVYYRESKYGELKKVDSKLYCLWETK